MCTLFEQVQSYRIKWQPSIAVYASQYNIQCESLSIVHIRIIHYSNTYYEYSWYGPYASIERMRIERITILYNNVYSYTPSAGTFVQCCFGSQYSGDMAACARFADGLPGIRNTQYTYNTKRTFDRNAKVSKRRRS